MSGSWTTTLKTDRWIKPFFKQYRRALVLALVLGLATFVFAGALMFTSGYLISRAAEMPGNILMIHLPVIFVRVFGIGKPIFQYFERLTSHDWVLRMTSSLRLKLYASLEGDAVFFKRSRRTGDVLGLLAEDIGHIQNLYLRTVFPTIVAYLLYIVIVIGLGFFSLWFALAVLLVLGVIVFLVPLVSALANGARLMRRKAMKNELYSELTDNVLGVSDWIFSHRGDEYLKRYKATEQAMRALDESMERFARRRDLVASVLYATVAVMLLVWAGSLFGGAHGGAANWIAAFVLGFFPLIDAFAPLPAAATEASAYRDSVVRLNALPVEKQTGAAAPEPAESLDIVIENLAFRYPGTEKDVLDSVTLSVKHGERLAILGKSGSGKSTLTSLIRGDLVPSSGSVALGGVPAHLLGDAMARYIGVIQQQTYLFNRTLRENLQIGRGDASDAEIWDVLDKVGLKPMVERLPEGLDTLVDEAGMRFSGGERHRIALARVLLQNVPIIMLDEPTVGLDPATEKALLETFFETTRDKTLIMVTHHLQGVAMMDRVVFVEDGKLALSGSPAELEEKSSRYRQLLAFDRGIAAV
ncbi:thiol reductant ABC exporter subunit CydC [Raoultibacter massiliensis]|uniref:Thiol reductant ABC exporter subunit CydC n=1 Tax=Raoultibacter massiliensis TaxID=1852371 RepID=A0ABV1JGV3_9ACTN|nr:thiol reductant ABC exporter subunit CydC [Raoultibacter massiliensis]